MGTGWRLRNNVVFGRLEAFGERVAWIARLNRNEVFAKRITKRTAWTTGRLALLSRQWFNVLAVLGYAIKIALHIFGPFHFHCHVLLRGVQVADILDFVKTVLQFHKLERVDIGGRACVARFASCKMLQSSKDIPHPTSRYIWSHELQWVKDDPWQAPKEKCFHCQSRRPKVSKELQELKKLTLTHADSYYEHKIFGFVFF